MVERISSDCEHAVKWHLGPLKKKKKSFCHVHSKCRIVFLSDLNMSGAFTSGLTEKPLKLSLRRNTKKCLFLD